MNSQSLKINISLFPKTLKWQLAHILKRAGRSIFTEDADNLTKPKTEQK